MPDQTKSVGIMSAEIASADGEFQLFPDGAFKAIDGRPKDAKAYLMDKVQADLIIAAFNLKKTPLVVDYEHQTLLSKENGKPAPAAGWVNGLEWREGKGLYAVNVEWTEAAKTAIKANEYRYISPVFQYTPKSGAIIYLHNAALTNNPAIDGMETAVAHSLNFELGQNNQGEINEEKQGGNADAENEAKRAALTLEIAKAETELATLTNSAAALKAEIDAEAERLERGKLEAEIDGYIAANQMIPEEREAALKLAQYDFVALKSILDTRACLFGCQTDRLHTAEHVAARNKPFNLTPADIRACELTGRSQGEFAALKAEFFNGKNPVHL
jgi:phage I-like protein